MSLAKKTKDFYDAMTKTEQQVAEYFLSHQQDFSFHTLDRIAREAGTSTTTVIRFCRRLGFAGFKEFQEKLQDEIKYQINLPDRMRRISNTTSDSDLLEQVVQRNIQNIFQSFSDISSETLDNAVSRISAAKHVYTFGMRESYSLAHYAYTRLTAIRNDVHILDAGYNGMIEAVLNLTPNDVCIVFLFHRYTNQTLRMLPLLQKQGVQIILITSAPFDSVTSFADVLLPCLVQIQGIKNSFVVPICLIDYFCNAVATFDSASSLARLELIESIL